MVCILIGQIKKMFLRPSLICFKFPSSVFFSELKKRGHLFYLCQNQNINIFMIEMYKKGTSLDFDEIENEKKKVASSVLWEIKK